MTDARIDGLRSIELGVHDLQKSAEFYRRVWALEDVAAEGDTIHLRGTGREHHVVTLRERPRASLLGVHFSAPDQNAVDALHAQAKAMGAKVGGAAEPLAQAFADQPRQDVVAAAHRERHDDLDGPGRIVLRRHSRGKRKS